MKKLLFAFAIVASAVACNGTKCDKSADSTIDSIDSIDTAVVDSVDSTLIDTITLVK